MPFQAKDDVKEHHIFRQQMASQTIDSVDIYPQIVINAPHNLYVNQDCSSPNCRQCGYNEFVVYHFAFRLIDQKDMYN